MTDFTRYWLDGEYQGEIPAWHADTFEAALLKRWATPGTNPSDILVQPVELFERMVFEGDPEPDESRDFVARHDFFEAIPGDTILKIELYPRPGFYDSLQISFDFLPSLDWGISELKSDFVWCVIRDETGKPRNRHTLAYIAGHRLPGGSLEAVARHGLDMGNKGRARLKLVSASGLELMKYRFSVALEEVGNDAIAFSVASAPSGDLKADFAGLPKTQPPGHLHIREGEGIHLQIGGVDEHHEGELVRRAPLGTFSNIELRLTPSGSE